MSFPVLRHWFQRFISILTVVRACPLSFTSENSSSESTAVRLPQPFMPNGTNKLCVVTSCTAYESFYLCNLEGLITSPISCSDNNRCFDRLSVFSVLREIYTCSCNTRLCKRAMNSISCNAHILCMNKYLHWRAVGTSCSQKTSAICLKRSDNTFMSNSKSGCFQE